MSRQSAESPSSSARRLQSGRYQTALAVPLLLKGEPAGVITVPRTVFSPFNDKQIELLKTFADQAIIAIENTRLFEEVQQKMERSPS